MDLFASSDNHLRMDISYKAECQRTGHKAFRRSLTMVHLRSAYSGFESKLVIAIDVGTTFSGASYTFLIPDEIPTIYNVGRHVPQSIFAYTISLPLYGPGTKGRKIDRVTARFLPCSFTRRRVTCLRAAQRLGGWNPKRAFERSGTRYLMCLIVLTKRLALWD